MNEELKVLLVSSEVSPYAKSGGLGDVCGSLPRELKKRGVDVRVVFPKYKSINKSLIDDARYICSFDINLDWRRQSASAYELDSGFPVYMIQNDYYFGRDAYYGFGDDNERFAFFSKAAIELLARIDFKPDIIHCNDWQTGLIPLYLRDNYGGFVFYSGIKTLYTIHNLQYQGVFGKETLHATGLSDSYAGFDKIEFRGGISYMKAGILHSDAVNTVSRTYAREIQTQAYGYGLEGLLRGSSHKLSGITNGVDFDINNPETDTRLFANYSALNPSMKAANKAGLQNQLGLAERADVPIISIVTRLVDQKGLDIIAMAADEMLSRDIQLVVLGTGDGKYEQLFLNLRQRYPDKMSVNIMFDEQLAQRIYSGSDMFLMPSRFEPCGLGQIIAMRYGTIPIVRNTGGLADTVDHYDAHTKTGNGFVFNDYLASGLIWALNEAIKTYESPEDWAQVLKNAMQSDNSWEKSAGEYIELYEKLKGNNYE